MRVDGDITKNFNISLDRNKDDYLIIVKNNNKYEYFVGNDIKINVQMLLSIINKGDYHIKYLLKEFVMNYLDNLIISTIESDKLKNYII